MSNVHLIPGGLGCCPFYGGDSAPVFLLCFMYLSLFAGVLC